MTSIIKRTNKDGATSDVSITYNAPKEVYNFPIENIKNIAEDSGFTNIEYENETILQQSISQQIFEGDYFNCAYSIGGGIETYTLSQQSSKTLRIPQFTDKSFSVKFISPISNTLNTIKIAINGWNGGTSVECLNYENNATFEVGYLKINKVCEAIYNPNTNKFIIYNVSYSNASETIKGILQIATQSQVNTGTNDTNAITPLKLATLLNNFGYITSYTTNNANGSQNEINFSNGLKIKSCFGTIPGAGGYTWTFTNAFPNKVLCLLATPGNFLVPQPVCANSHTTSYVVWDFESGAYSRDFWGFAIGY